MPLLLESYDKLSPVLISEVRNAVQETKKCKAQGKDEPTTEATTCYDTMYPKIQPIPRNAKNSKKKKKKIVTTNISN